MRLTVGRYNKALALHDCNWLLPRIDDGHHHMVIFSRELILHGRLCDARFLLRDSASKLRRFNEHVFVLGAPGREEQQTEEQAAIWLS